MSFRSTVSPRRRLAAAALLASQTGLVAVSRSGDGRSGAALAQQSTGSCADGRRPSGRWEDCADEPGAQPCALDETQRRYAEAAERARREFAG